MFLRVDVMEDLRNLIPQHDFDLLLKADINDYKTIVLKSTDELSNLTSLSAKHVENIKIKVAQINLANNKIITVSELKEYPKLSTGVKKIDEVTRGGLYANGINEIFGVSGVGKTQMALQLALMVQLPANVGGFGLKKTIFLCTEDNFPSTRLQDMITERKEHFKEYKTIEFDENILVEKILETEHLVNFILNRIDCVPNLGLIIIDSIAGIFRCEGIDFQERSIIFRKIAKKLYEIASKGIVVLCINQVTDNFDKEGILPTLGLTWRNLVTSRFELSRIGDTRYFQPIFAPNLASKKVEFKIAKIGLVDTD